MTPRIRTIPVLVGLLLSRLGAIPVVVKPPHQWVEVMVQERDMSQAAAAARAHGREVTHELGIINGVSARVP